MKVVDNNTYHKQILTLNDVPVGTVFRGTIVGFKVEVTGIFFKQFGAWIPTDKHGTLERERTRDVVVVQLDHPTNDVPSIFNWCRTVKNYEALDVELVVKGVQ